MKVGATGGEVSGESEEMGGRSSERAERQGEETVRGKRGVRSTGGLRGGGVHLNGDTLTVFM
jgi:hypothetical protein